MNYILFILLSPWLLWVFYAAIMRLKMVRDANGLTTAMKVFGYPALVIGYVIDLVVNVVAGTIVFREMPREWTLSERLWRLSNGQESWRQKRALAIRVALLDAIDPAGIHRG